MSRVRASLLSVYKVLIVAMVAISHDATTVTSDSPFTRSRRAIISRYVVSRRKVARTHQNSPLLSK